MVSMILIAFLFQVSLAVQGGSCGYGKYKGLFGLCYSCGVRHAHCKDCDGDNCFECEAGHYISIKTFLWVDYSSCDGSGDSHCSKVDYKNYERCSECQATYVRRDSTSLSCERLFVSL